jgi:hypothetical protein
MRIPVPAKRRIEIDVYRLNVAQVNTNEQINESIVLMKGCYAQVALEISATVHQAARPQEVEEAKIINGSTSGPGVFRLLDLFPNLNVGTLTNEYKAFIDGLDIHGVNIFFLTTMFGSNGHAVSIKQLGRETNLQMKYIDNAFINFQMLNGAPLGHTPSHELLHVLEHKDLDEDDHAQFYANLLFVGNANDESVFLKENRLSSGIHDLSS